MPKKIIPAEPWSDAITHLKSVDQKFSDLIVKVGPCQLKPADDYLKTLAQAIISQQISTKAAETIFGRVSAAIDGRWTADSMTCLDSDYLQKCGVSQQKRNYILSLLDCVGSGRLNLSRIHELDDEQIIETLTQVKGIGRWTAEMFLIFGLNRPDVLPVADLGIKDALKRYFVLSEHPKPNECERLTQTWRPYRSVAMWYLWRLSD
jgi:DNA-3-methyladenine glycosylase II